MELRGLVSALGLNGQLCECGEFDSSLGRYSVLTSKGDLKKVKRENLNFVTRYSQKAVSAEELEKNSLAQKSFFGERALPAPLVIPARLFRDWHGLPDRSTRNFLVQNKGIPISALPGKSRVFFVSTQRREFFSEISNQSDSAMAAIVRLAAALEAKYEIDQIYLAIPGLLGELDAVLPSHKAAVLRGYPFAVAFAAGGVIVISETDDIDFAWQRFDCLIAETSRKPIYLMMEKSTVNFSLLEDKLTDKVSFKSMGAIFDGKGGDDNALKTIVDSLKSECNRPIKVFII